VGGHDLWGDEVAARRRLAYVPEQPDLTPYATVREVLDLVRRLRGEPRESMDEALEFVGLSQLGHRSVRELSMGQRRKAVLASALIGTPRHVLLDEPLEAMDRSAREDVLAWIDRLLASGAVVLAVSHDLEPFAPRAARALTVRNGRCLLADPLPEDPTARQALLERLARGEPVDGQALR
jgi:Cu-processing system ATP-binding protein